MIVVVTPNPAIDITSDVPGIELHETVRVRRVTERAGGKGLNVARVLARLGEIVAPFGFVGGEEFLELVAQSSELADLDSTWIPVPERTRRTVVVVESAGATLFSEPGAPLPPGAWHRLVEAVSALVGPGDVVCVCGSFPPDTAPGSLSRLIASVRESGARTIADTSGAWLREAAQAGADVVKPNERELLHATGADDVVVGARRLLNWGAREVVASCGADGLRLFSAAAPGTWWEARSSGAVTGNPTGAGDAVVASLARSLHTGGALYGQAEAALRDATALGGAAVAAAVAGEYVEGVRSSIADTAVVRMIDAAL